MFRSRSGEQPVRQLSADAIPLKLLSQRKLPDHDPDVKQESWLLTPEQICAFEAQIGQLGEHAALLEREQAGSTQSRERADSDTTMSDVCDAVVAAKRAASGAAYGAESDLPMSMSGYQNGSISIRPSHYHLEIRKLREDNQRLQNENQRLSFDLGEASNSTIEAEEKRLALESQVGPLRSKLAIALKNKAQHQEERHQLIGVKQRQEKELSQLQDQVKNLKSIISASTRPAAQIDDATINRQVESLFRNVQRFVLRHFKGAKFEFDRVPEHWRTWMNDFIPYAHLLQKGRIYNVAISVISQVLTSRFNARNYFGLPDRPPIIAATELADALQPSERKETKPWLELTRKLLDLNLPSVLDEAVDGLKQSMVEDVGNVLSQATHIEWTEDLQKDLAKVFGFGLDLFRLLLQQQTSFTIEMVPAFVNGKPQSILPEFMEDVESVEDSETLAGRKIEISVFPLVQKLAEEGEEIKKTVIYKAKVVPGKKALRINRKRCAPQQDDRSSDGILKQIAFI